MYRLKTTPPPEEDILLESEMEATLRTGIRELPAPQAAPGFNMRVLTALTSGRDFDPWWRQAKTRLRWMALPAVVGYAVMLLIAAGTTRPIHIPDMPRPVAALPLDAPPLPPLPKKLFNMKGVQPQGAPVLRAGGSRGTMGGGGMAPSGAAGMAVPAPGAVSGQQPSSMSSGAPAFSGKDSPR